MRHNSLWHLCQCNSKGRLTSPLFLCKIERDYTLIMDREKVRMIVRNMDLLVQSLRHEIEGPPANIVIEKDAMVTPYSEDYDEVY